MVSDPLVAKTCLFLVHSVDNFLTTSWHIFGQCVERNCGKLVGIFVDSYICDF
jgi:hypothetical protein